MESSSIEPLLRDPEVEKILGFSKGFCAKDRLGKARIPFVRIGSRAVRYKPADVRKFIEDSMRNSTSDATCRAEVDARPEAHARDGSR
jgi:predicted DNA-binding transcriptional regulator AlpA